MSIDRQMVKEDKYVYIYSGILLSHRKEKNWVIHRSVDGPRVVHSELSQKEKNMPSS